MNLNVKTEVVWGVKKLELALALDVTGSMASNNKMTELKKAAKSLLTTLKNAAKKDGDVKVAIVPFAVVVNVGNTNVNATWLDWSDWSSASRSYCMTRLTLQQAGSQSNQDAWDPPGPGSSCPFTNGTHGFQCTDGPGQRIQRHDCWHGLDNPRHSERAHTLRLICPSMDNGSKSTAATGLLNNQLS